MTQAVSSNPVERDKAELEKLMGEFAVLTGQEPTDEGSTETAPTPEPQAQGEPEPEPQSTSDDSFEQKWKTLQGIVKAKDAQIATITQQIDQLVSQNSQLIGQVQQLQSATTNHVNTPDDSPSDQLMDLAADLSDKYGEELGTFLTQVAEHVKRVEGQVKETGVKLNDVGATLSASKAEEKLTQLCPVWRQVDSDQAFIAHLQNATVPYSNQKMIDLLNEKWSAGDIDTVATIFNDYINASSPTTNQPPAADPRERLVTPGTKGAAHATPPANNQGKTYSEAEISRMTKDLQSGVYRGNPAKAKEVEHEITLAYLENRVR